MSRSLRFDWLARRARRNPTPSPLPPHRRSLRFEPLEDRRLLAVFTVDNLNDSGEGSLRDAIEQANFDVVADIINFGPLFNTPQTISIASQLPAITHALTITGPGANRLTIDAGHGGWRIFNVDNGNSSIQIDVAISGLALTGGDVGVGGAINNAENLTISNSWIYNNAALFGGGVVNSGTLTVEGSTISGNTATMGGGGINSSGSAVIRNSTISGNDAGLSSGGGITNYAPPAGTASLTIENSTITNNTANVGEALHSFGVGTPTATISNSILNGSVVKAGTLTGNNNLFSGVDPGITGTANQFEANPSLSPLADNGGPTRTHALLAGSPAINAGGTTGLTSDQRGAPFQRVAGGVVDIGAYERQTLAPAMFVVTTTADEFDYSNATVSLREAISSANGSVGADVITFASGLSGQTIVLTGGQLLLTDAVTIDAASLAENVTINANLQSRIFEITAFGGNVTLAGLTLTGGRTTADHEDGGAIRAATWGLLELRESTVSGNGTTGNFAIGGAIYTYGAVTLTQSTVSGNSTTGGFAPGGAIYARGAVTLTESTLSGNSSEGESSTGGGAHARGGVTITQSIVSGNSTAGLNSSGGGTYTIGGGVAITQSTVSGNSTAGNNARGGGIYSRLSEVTLTQSTVSGNTTTGNSAHGGGIYSHSYFGPITFIQSTFSGNSATGYLANGGGVAFTYNDAGSRTLRFSGAIIAGNTVGGGSGPDLALHTPIFFHVDYSLIGNTSGSGINMSTGAGNILDQPALLGPLGHNGGPTQTHALLPGSPALDAGLTGVLDDFSANNFAANFNFVNVFSVPTNNPLTVDGVAQLNVNNGAAAHIWNQGQKLQNVGDVVSVDLGFNYPLENLNGYVNGAAGLALFSEVTGGTLLTEVRVNTGINGTATIFNLEDDVPGVGTTPIVGTPTGLMHLQIRLTGATETTITIESTLSGPGIETVVKTKTLNATEAYFGPTAFNVVSDDSIHDNLAFAAAAIGTVDQRGLPRVVNGDAVSGARIDMGAYEAQGPVTAAPGDYNRDGSVDAADYTVWRNNLGVDVAPLTGADGDGNGMVDATDYLVWKSHYGFTYTLPAFAGASATAYSLLASAAQAADDTTSATDAAFSVFDSPRGNASPLRQNIWPSRASSATELASNTSIDLSLLLLDLVRDPGDDLHTAVQLLPNEASSPDGKSEIMPLALVSNEWP